MLISKILIPPKNIFITVELFHVPPLLLLYYTSDSLFLVYKENYTVKCPCKLFAIKEEKC